MCVILKKLHVSCSDPSLPLCKHFVFRYQYKKKVKTLLFADFLNYMQSTFKYRS